MRPVVPLVLLGVMLTLSACREADIVKEVEKSVERSIALMQNNKTRREGFVLGEKVKNDILSMTNPVARTECRNAFAGVLLSFDFTSSGLDYRTQGDLLGSIPKLVEGALFGPMWEGDELLNVYEVRFKLVDWHRQQLVRLKPTRKNDPHDGMSRPVIHCHFILRRYQDEDATKAIFGCLQASCLRGDQARQVDLDARGRFGV